MGRSRLRQLDTIPELAPDSPLVRETKGDTLDLQLGASNLPQCIRVAIGIGELDCHARKKTGM